MSDQFEIKDLDSGKVVTWSIYDILNLLNTNRGIGWEDYDESDWVEGWGHWVENNGDYEMINFLVIQKYLQ